MAKCPKCQFENPADTRYCGNCAAPLTDAREIAFPRTMTIQRSQEAIAGGTVWAGKYRIIEPVGRGGMGERDEAFRWLEEAVKGRMIFIPWLRQNPAYAPLRSDPRFEDLVRRMKLPEAKRSVNPTEMLEGIPC